MNLARIALFALVAVLSGAPAFAQEDQAVIQERMKSRIAQVDELKLAGLVGENNKGLLEQRGAVQPAQTAVMNAENADRRALYNILATRLGVTVAIVGEQRAATLRDKSAPGVLLQAPDGTWYKK